MILKYFKNLYYKLDINIKLIFKLKNRQYKNSRKKKLEFDW